MTLLIRIKRSQQWWILRPARRSVTCCTAVEVLVELLSHVLSGHSKVPHQGSSCVALVHLEEGKCWPFPAPTYPYLQVDKGNSAQSTRATALSDRWIAGLLSSGAWLASRLPVTQGAKQAGYHRISHKMEYVLLWHLETGWQLVPVEIVGIAVWAPKSLKQQLHRIFISSGGLEPTLWSYNLQVQGWCGYQQRCLDTGKLGDVQRFQT